MPGESEPLLLDLRMGGVSSGGSQEVSPAGTKPLVQSAIFVSLALIASFARWLVLSMMGSEINSFASHCHILWKSSSGCFPHLGQMSSLASPAANALYLGQRAPAAAFLRRPALPIMPLSSRHVRCLWITFQSTPLASPAPFL